MAGPAQEVAFLPFAAQAISRLTRVPIGVAWPCLPTSVGSLAGRSSHARTRWSVPGPTAQPHQRLSKSGPATVVVRDRSLSPGFLTDLSNGPTAV